MGLGGQLIAWDTEFCESLVDRGFYVIRYDNRDVGLSTTFEGASVDFLATMTAVFAGEEVQAPYLLHDMAADAVGLLDALDVRAAHVVGVSMGGMIAQTIAIEHPERVLTLTSIMSTTGDRDVGQPTPEAMKALMSAPPRDRDAAIEQSVVSSRLIGSPDHLDEDRTRARAAEAYDRAFNPAGVGRQLVAVLASGSRTDKLRELDVPTLVIHGSADPLVTLSGGERTAEAVPNAKLLVIDGMGHDLPPVFWPQIIEAITNHAAQAAVEA
jgi:pimeloyl-ACP methyl ester carboxylesterase